jgi:hypothetical protein
MAERVRFDRARFGIYDTIDFLVVLIGYSLSGEPTLKTFYEHLLPFATPFMALFGRDQLPDRSTLSRFLFEMVLSDEDKEQDPDRWVSHTPVFPGVLANHQPVVI